jgi:drug/metabolite transporter (DMT)-like permease
MFGYWLANICLRSVAHLDPVFVSEIKALPTVLATLPLVLMRMGRGQMIISSTRMALLIVVVALLGQLIGNVGFQWSLGQIGMALSVPLNFGTMIVSGALLGHWWLGDHVTRGMIWASLVLLLAICLLSLGAPQASTAVAPSTSMSLHAPSGAVAGVAATCVSGMAYGLLSVTLRFASNRGVTISVLLFFVSLVGCLSLSTWFASKQQGVPWQAVSGTELAFLLGAGVCNLVAFAALTRALQLSSVMFVNVLSASQTALAAMAGVILFREPVTWSLLAGVALTVGGLTMAHARAAPDSHVAPPDPSANSEHRDRFGNGRTEPL